MESVADKIIMKKDDKEITVLNKKIHIEKLKKFGWKKA